MGQSQSHFEKPIGHWNRSKKKATSPQLSQGRSVQLPLRIPAAKDSPAQTDQSSTHADQSPTIATTTTANIAIPASATPSLNIQGDVMADTSGKADKADEADKVEEPSNGLQDRPAVDRPDDAKEPEKPKQPTPSPWEPAPDRPALKHEYTPPDRIRLETFEAWQTNSIYGNVHDHITRTLNLIRKQQNESRRPSVAAKKLEKDIYNAADSCTVSLEYLVGNFSTKLFHYTGPENIRCMMAVIEADASALDDLRLQQQEFPNYGYTLEKKIAKTEEHIRNLGDLAKRIREEGFEEAEDGEADADGETDPDWNGEEDKEMGTSC